MSKNTKHVDLQQLAVAIGGTYVEAGTGNNLSKTQKKLLSEALEEDPKDPKRVLLEDAARLARQFQEQSKSRSESARKSADATRRKVIEMKDLLQKPRSFWKEVTAGASYVTAAPKFVDDTIRLFKKVGFNPMGTTKFDFDTEVIFTKESDSGIYFKILIDGNEAKEGVVSQTVADLRKLRDALVNLGKSMELVKNVDLGM